MNWGSAFLGAGLSLSLAAALVTYGHSKGGAQTLLKLFYSLGFFPSDAVLAGNLPSAAAIGTSVASILLALAAVCFAVAAVSFIRNRPKGVSAQEVAEAQRNQRKGRL